MALAAAIVFGACALLTNGFLDGRHAIATGRYALGVPAVARPINLGDVRELSCQARALPPPDSDRRPRWCSRARLVRVQSVRGHVTVPALGLLDVHDSTPRRFAVD